MTNAYPIAPLYPVFTGLDGKPLEAGYIYIGAAGQNPEASPAAVFWDEDLTIPAAQPIRTIAGYPSRNGSPAAIFTAGDFSITVRDRNRVLIYTGRNGAFPSWIYDALSALRGWTGQAFDADGRTGLYPVNYMPNDQSSVLLLVDGVPQEFGRDYTFESMPSAASGFGLRIIADPVITAPVRLRLLYTRQVEQGPGEPEMVFTPEMFGAAGDGTGDDSTAIIAALTLAAGRKVVGTAGAVYRITATISYVGDVNLDLSMSDVLVAADVAAFDFKAPAVGPFALTSDYDLAGSPLALATATLPFAPKAGQVVWIASRARDPGDRDNGSSSQQYRVGEAFRLGAGSTTSALVLQAPLAHSEGISPTSTAGDEARVPAYTVALDTRLAMPDMDARCSVRLPVIEYEDGHDGDGWSVNAVEVWGYVNPVVEVGGVKRGYGPAVRVWGTYGATIRDISVSNLTDNAPDQVGYGVADGGWNTRVIGLTAHNVRHTYTTSKSTSSYTVSTFDAWKIMTFGRTAGAQIEGGIASGGVSALWDTHHDAQDVLFDGNVADGCGSDGFAVRGRNITVANPIIRNCGSGIRVFTEYDSGDPDDDIYTNGKLLSDFTSCLIDSPQMDVRQACIDVRAATAALSGAGRYRSQSGCVVYNSGGTLSIGGTHRFVADGALVAADGSGLIHIGANNAFSSMAFPQPSVVIDGVVEIDARGWTGAALTAILTSTGTRLVVRGILRLLLPTGATLFSGGTSEVVCEGAGRIEYSIAGSAGIVTGLSSRPIYLVDLTSGAVMDGTTRANRYVGYNQLTDAVSNSLIVNHGSTGSGGLILRNTDTGVSNGEHLGGITIETNDTSNPAMAAARILSRGDGSQGFVQLAFQRTTTPGSLFDALVIDASGHLSFMRDDGTTTAAFFNANTGAFLLSPPGPYANDAAAASAGVNVGQLYRVTGGAVAWRQV